MCTLSSGVLLFCLQEVAECRYTVDITDQAAFETGISHQAQLSGKYSKDGDDIAYTKGPEPFTLTATPDPKVSLDLTTCETASAREYRRLENSC